MTCRTDNGRPRRHAFTLPELLIVIGIIALLASTLLFAMWGAMEDAKASRTRTQIAKINEFIMARWESYETRPVSLRFYDPNWPLRPQAGMTPAQHAETVGYQRLAALRELMRMELPDRKTDLLFANRAAAEANPPNPLDETPDFLAQPPTAWLEMRRRVTEIYGPGSLADGWPDWSLTYEGAECLYLILTTIREVEGSSLQFFRENEVGDLDGDGMPEILDAWGNPVTWIRWPHGYTLLSPLQVANGETHPDPFDPLKVDPRWREFTGDDDPAREPYAMFPLIFSGGRDEVYGLIHRHVDDFSYARTTPSNDPYHQESGLEGFGAPVDWSAQDWNDNITNHLLEVR